MYELTKTTFAATLYVAVLVLLMPSCSPTKKTTTYQRPKSVPSQAQAQPKPSEATIKQPVEVTSSQNQSKENIDKEVVIYNENNINKSSNTQIVAKPTPATATYKSGIAEYKIQYAMRGDVDASVLAARPFREHITFTERNALVKKQSTTGTTTESVDMRTGRRGVFETILGKKYLVQEEAQLVHHVRPTTDTKTIQGMVCKKAEATTTDGHKIEIYYTDALGIRFAPVAPVEGFTLEYTIQKPNERIFYTLDKISWQKIDEKDAMLVGKYETLTREELTRRTFKGSLVAFMERAPAQDFALTDMEGKNISLSDFSGKVVVLNFWFAACAPCRQEIPNLNTVKERYKDRDVEFLAVTYDEPQTVLNFTKQLPFDFRILPSARPVMDAYKLLMYPTTIVIDRSGNVSKIKEGATGVMELSSAIDRAL